MHVSWKQWPVDGSLPPHVQEYVEWVVDPERDPPSKLAWAKAHGFDKATVYGWHRDKRVVKGIEEAAAAINVNPETTQDIVNAIRAEAKKGNMKAAELYLRYIERLQPTKIVVTDERIEKLSPEEFAAELAAHGLDA